MLTLTPEQRSNKVTVADWLISYRDSESRKKRGAKQEVGWGAKSGLGNPGA